MLRSLIRRPLILFFPLLAACAGGDTPMGPTVPPTPPALDPLPPGTLVLAVVGLPAGTQADVSVSGTSFARPATGSVTWSDLLAGRYTVTVRPARGADGTFAADSASLIVDVLSGGPPSVVTVRYRALPSVLDLQLRGVPGGAEAPVRVQPPSGTTVNVPLSSVLTDSARGTWRVYADTLVFGGVRYAPSSSTIDLMVLLGDTVRVSVDFAVSSGALALSVQGLPVGVSSEARVEGPNGFVQTVSGSATLTALTPGAYRVISSAIAVTGVQYVPDPDTLALTVTASLVAAPAVVQYRAQTGRLIIATSGLPTGVAPIITVSGASAVRSITGNTTLDSLPAGSYTVVATALTFNGVRYAPEVSSQSLIVSTGGSTTLLVAYAVVPTVVDVVITGLPNGVGASGVLTSPDNTDTPLSATTRITPATAGRWRLAVASVVKNGQTWEPTRSAYDSTVSAGDTLRFRVAYMAATGSMALGVVGLPGGVLGQVTVTGPDGFSASLSGTTTLSTLTPGSYTVAAGQVTSSGTTFIATPAVTVQAITANSTSSVVVTYVASGPNYSIEQVHLTQATQRFDGSVPLVAGRDALLRVFVMANENNSARPDVRVRVYDGATLLQTTLIPAPEHSVRQSLSLGSLSSSWNVIVPAAQLRPGLRVLAELDPAAQLNETTRSDNVWPASGPPQSITVYDVPSFSVRLIPVVTGALIGDVNQANASAFLESARLMFPLNEINADVRAPFTSSATELQSNDGNGSWLTVLSEINALRATDSAPGSVHYYGVVATSYNSGVAGYGYLPGRAAIGWDKMPSGDGVAAHEWGHNFGVFHAPCGTAGDPRYPYPNADIGQVGWNGLTNALVASNAKDLMSYCSNTWISDYTWSAVMQYRGTSSMLASTSDATTNNGKPTDGLLVWGRVINGRIELEPAFRVRAPLSPSVQGTHRIELLDDDGTLIGDVGVAATRVDHVSNREERHFAVVLPFSNALASQLASIRVRDVRSPLLSVTRASAVRAQLALQQAARPGLPASASTSADPAAQFNIVTRSSTRISWSNRAYTMAMVRDAQSGEVMGFVRRSGDAVVTNGRPVEVVFSDGVRSAVRR